MRLVQVTLNRGVSKTYGQRKARENHLAHLAHSHGHSGIFRWVGNLPPWDAPRTLGDILLELLV